MWVSGTVMVELSDVMANLQGEFRWFTMIYIYIYTPSLDKPESTKSRFSMARLLGVLPRLLRTNGWRCLGRERPFLRSITWQTLQSHGAWRVPGSVEGHPSFQDRPKALGDSRWTSIPVVLLLLFPCGLVTSLVLRISHFGWWYPQFFQVSPLSLSPLKLNRYRKSWILSSKYGDLPAKEIIWTNSEISSAR